MKGTGIIKRKTKSPPPLTTETPPTTSSPPAKSSPPEKCPPETGNDLDLETMLKRKLDYLTFKEKELNELQKQVEKKMKKFNKNRHTKAKADLRAAKKLNRARKKLTFAVYCNERRDKKHKKNHKKYICDECDPNNWCNKIHSMANKFLHSNHCPCLTSKKSAIGKLCKQYYQKVVTSCPDEDSVGDTTGRKKKCSYVDAASADCSAIGKGWMPQRLACPAFPACSNFTARKKRAAHGSKYRKLRFILLLLATFLFWSPCLLILLLCFCCFCNSDC